MAFKQTFSCTTCGTDKGVGNRWLLGFRAHLPNIRLHRRAYALGDWNSEAALTEGVDHFCSEHCALAEQAKHLRRDRVEAETPIPSHVLPPIDVLLNPPDRKLHSSLSGVSFEAHEFAPSVEHPLNCCICGGRSGSTMHPDA